MKTRRALKQQLRKKIQKSNRSRSKRAKRRSDRSLSSSDEKPKARKRQHSTTSVPKVKDKKVKKGSTRPKKSSDKIIHKPKSSSKRSPSPEKKVQPPPSPPRSPRRTDLNKRQQSKSLSKKPSPVKIPAKTQVAKPNIKTVTMAGNYPVDQYFTVRDCHIIELKNKVYSATLNMTKITQNNNKFYLIQAIQQNQGKSCYLWTRWGRVGSKGQSAILGPTVQQIVLNQYQKKFREKHIKGDYKHLEISYNDDQEKDCWDAPVDAPKKSIPPHVIAKERAKDIEQSKLSIPVRNLINLIFDSGMMNRQMKQIGYDVDKMPLGKLSKETIRKGYSALKQLMQEVLKSTRDQNNSIIQDLNNTFYSYIPHDFGFAQMRLFILNTKEKVQNKLELLESLENITLANKILKDNKSDTNITDQNYAKLDRDILPLSPICREYQIIEEYIINTHAKTHNAYSLKINNVFKLDREDQNHRYTKQIHNKMLLWHGSRLTNYAGILSQGLRIAPPEAPVTGYMFGKGVYFADMVSKSANYCFTNRDNTTGLLLLCQVALGFMNQKTQADCYANLLPPGKHSTKGVGKTFPPIDSYVDLNGAKVPLGEGVQNQTSTSLLYNQYIVYDVAQVKLKYLVQVNFQYY